MVSLLWGEVRREHIFALAFTLEHDGRDGRGGALAFVDGSIGRMTCGNHV